MSLLDNLVDLRQVFAVCCFRNPQGGMKMAEDRGARDQRDLVLGPGEYAYIQDRTKG